MSIAALTILDGAWIFLAVVLVMLAGAIHSLYTAKGSGISQRPYHNHYTGQAGASIPSTLDHDRFAATNYTRGTR
jgi:hypothetical protein